MKKHIFLFSLIITGTIACFSQSRYYVSAIGTPTGNALSWATACNDLQLILNNAAPCDTIWVAQGTYVPIRPADSLWKVDSNNRDNAFVITKGLYLYGGFTGTETDISQRQLPAQGSNGLSVLSGDIGILNDSTDNAYHVVLIATRQDSVLLDGFTVTGGISKYFYIGNDYIIVNGISFHRDDGSGIYCTSSSLRLNYMSIIRNAAGWHGGSVISYSGDLMDSSSLLMIYNSLIAYNSTVDPFYNTSSTIASTVRFVSIYNTTITCNTFNNNNVLQISNAFRCVLSHVQIISNISNSAYGTAMGIHDVDTCLIFNTLIANNIDLYGGYGIIYYSQDSDTINNFFCITNSTIVNNCMRMWGDGTIANDRTTSTPIYIRNSILWGNKGHNPVTGNYNEDDNQSEMTFYSNCLLGRSCNKNWEDPYHEWLPVPPGAIIADPLFVDTAARDYRLQCGSPAVNMGYNAFFHPDSIPNLSHILTDLEGNPRFFNNGTVDIGCYELQQTCKPFIILPEDTLICQGDSIDIAITLSGTAPWELVYATNNKQDTIKNITSNPYLWRVSPQNTALYAFTHIKDTYFDTLISDSITVSVISLPVLTSVLSNDTLCSGENTKEIIFSGTADTYQWEAIGDEISAIPTGLQTGDFDLYRVENNDTVLLSTNIIVTHSITINNKTCYGLPDSFSITVCPVIQLEASVNDSLFCEGDSILFVLFNTEELTNPYWQRSDEFSLQGRNPVIPNANSSHSGIYIVRARKSNYCVIPDTVQITVLSALITDMEDTLFMCDFEEITIYSNTSNADDYVWSTGETSANINVSNPGTYYMEASNKRCVVLDTVIVMQINISDFELITSGDLCNDGKVELIAQIENVSYQWNTGDTSKIIIISVEGLYSVSVEAGHCQAYKKMEINCPCKIFLPNVFTPVQGKVYLPEATFTINTFSMHIYDRWGNIVFKTDQYSAWDGTKNGKPVSDGVYYCVVSYTCADLPDKMIITQSSITVMR